MASGKVKKASAQKAKINLIKGIVIAVILLCIGGYFVYVSGILPKLVTGVKIVETAADGTQTTVQKVSVLETNYRFNEALNMYSMYGMVDKDNLDKVMDSESKQTYREFLYKTVADELMNSALIMRHAKAKNFEQMSGCDRYVELQTESIRATAAAYNYKSINQYLQALFGTGFYLSDYKSFLKSECITTEYQNYLKQFEFYPTEQEVQDEYNKNPNEYQVADFNYYLFSADMDESGNITGLEDTVKNAQAVADAVNGGKTFKDAVKTVLEQDKTKNEQALVSFSDDSVDPTFVENYSHSTAEYRFKEEVANVLYGADAVKGKAVVVKLDNGTYVVCLADRRQDSTLEVTYRTLTLSNDAAADATEAEINAGVDKLRQQADSIISCVTNDSRTFVDAINKNTSNTSEIINGGIVTGETAANYEPSKSEDGSETPVDTALGAWLFDASRQKGDTYVSVSSDNKTLTIYYFESTNEAWYCDIVDKFINDRTEAWQTALKENNPSYEINSGWLKNLMY